MCHIQELRGEQGGVEVREGAGGQGTGFGGGAGRKHAERLEICEGDVVGESDLCDE